MHFMDAGFKISVALHNNRKRVRQLNINIEKTTTFIPAKYIHKN